ncbi:ORF6N domain-containing protein [Adlercreutzia shanghongiae]|uniref:ORF6N domain-containing protein n=1 Tax=Adlercreutzia shanghongiae TaxID=3111773 RepID=A0ABU6IVF1_9ACTN|nr:ORF6N domain-containing protein [Adlercreutzia sp. R22]MEC4293809.1 ORF6N domain-containing protein [Adlercreutzia sp. R22]
MNDFVELAGVKVELRSLIYTVRGQQVMLDRDLAALYGVETKAFNQAVKRNEGRFPSRFRFRLTASEAENLRSQIVTSSWGGTRYLPYAFTEQGVAMLSAVLRSDRAIEVSIGIMDAFVEMRRSIMRSAGLSQRMSALEGRQLEHERVSDERFEKIFGYLEASAVPTQRIFYEGETFDAFVLLSSIVRKAEEEIVLVDGYIDAATLNVLAKKKENVRCAVVTYPGRGFAKEDLAAFEWQHGPLAVAESRSFHDRFLVLDGREAYHVGASLKDAGKRAFALSRLEDPAMVANLVARIEGLFDDPERKKTPSCRPF